MKSTMIQDTKTYDFTNKGLSVSVDNFDSHWARSWVGKDADGGHGGDEEESGLHDENDMMVLQSRKSTLLCKDIMVLMGELCWLCC
jgi:hypothetical protein